MKTIGITGGVGVGKSAVLSGIEKRYNCIVLYTDALAADLEKKGQPCYQKILETFGKGILLADGEMDRRKVGELVFGHPENLKKLNEIVHPAVKSDILKRIREEKEKGRVQYFFIESALFIEGGYDQILDELWYIYASKETRRKRLKESRGYSDEKITQMLERQMPDEVFRAKCDVVIDNSGDLNCTWKQIDEKLGEGHLGERSI